MGTGTRSGKREPDRLYQRDGVYYARITIDGRDQRQSLKTRDRAEAARRLKSWLEGRSAYHGTVRHTFSQAAALWLDAGEWKPKTLHGYVKLLNVLETRFGAAYWDQVDKAALQAFAADRRAKGSGTATINRYLSVISGIADHVRELPGWPEINPVTLLPKKPRRERNKRYVRPPSEDIEAIFARMHGTFGDLCRMALLTGARLDELASLKTADARHERIQIWNAKHEFRVIPLAEDALSIVDRQPRGESVYLFETRNGDRYKRVTEMWREVCRTAQKTAQKNGRILTLLRFHDLRHEYAIRYLESGGSIYTLQKLLGHSTIGQTEHYLRYLTPDQAGAAKC